MQCSTSPFRLLDLNEGGLTTPSEAGQSQAVAGGSYRNENAEVLAPHRTIISEIDVSEDYLIADLNVQISITHTYSSYLDAYLTGPDGQRIELFAAVGGDGDHFDQTTFDDQSKFPIMKARAPFKGTFMPGALVKRQPSLSHFNGKSVKGVWQLVVRGTRNERFGMLHSWGLIVRPQSDALDSTPTPPQQDGPQPTAGLIRQRDGGSGPVTIWSPTQTPKWVRSGSAARGDASREEPEKAEARTKIEAAAKYRAWIESKRRGDKKTLPER